MISSLVSNFLYVLHITLSYFQVIDLKEEAPDSVLRRFFLNLERLKNEGAEIASEIEKNLRLIVSCEQRELNGVRPSLFFLGYFNASNISRIFDVQVAGGDGTAGWLLGVVSDLKLSQPPPIATVPLGTGNNLPFAFGWVRNPIS